MPSLKGLRSSIYAYPAFRAKSWRSMLGYPVSSRKAGLVLGGSRGLQRLEVEFQGFFQIGEGFFFDFALTGNIYFKALRDVPITFTPNGCGKWTFHAFILAQEMDATNIRRFAAPVCRLGT